LGYEATVQNQLSFNAQDYWRTTVNNIVSTSNGIIFLCPFANWDEEIAMLRELNLPVILINRKTQLQQEIVAIHLKITRQTYTQLENGKRDVTIGIAKKMAEIFKKILMRDLF